MKAQGHRPTLAVLLTLAFGWVAPANAQDPDKDAALDGLLKKLEQQAEPPAPAEPPKEDDALDDLLKKLEGTPAPDASSPKPKGELAPKDQALDNLLEKLGQTEETPAPDGKRPIPGGGDADTPPKPGRAGPDALKGKEKDLDEHLEELTGRKRKKENQGGEGEGDEGNPLSDVIKKMRDVEQRLGEPDTGADTRQKQKQIVESLDQVIEQLKNPQGQSQGKMTKLVQQKQQGQQPGSQPGQPGAQGNQPQGVGASKPSRPTDEHVSAGGKDAWGHLPPELRGLMENVFREEELPAKADLIRRYYLSVSKKSQSGGR